MDFQRINPLDFPEWDDLLLESGDSSFFHTTAWAKVLHESYGYKPVCFVRRDNSRLHSVMPFMDIASPLTGRRGVSLPFTDDCDPFGLEESMDRAVQAVIDHGRRSEWRYAEWRTTGDPVQGATTSESYLTHDLDLGRSESELFAGLRENNKRNIRKAAKEGVTVRFERSPEALREFYRLHCLTRRKHCLPPQPFVFFRSILEHILSRDRGVIVSAFLSGKVVASSMFFHFGPNAIFKYGASDPAALPYRPNNLVMWEAIKWYRERKATALSLGRTEMDNDGLRRFKLSWGASEGALKYSRYDFDRVAFTRASLRGSHPSKLFSRIPIAVLRFAGRLLYKHIG